MERDAAILRIETRSAEPVEVRVEHTRGSIARPLTDEELQDKVQTLVTPVLGDGAADRIRKAVDNLPGSSDVSGLLIALRPSAGAPGLGGVRRVQSAPPGAPNDAASHPRRHAAAPAQGTATDQLLALAARLSFRLAQLAKLLFVPGRELSKEFQSLTAQLADLQVLPVILTCITGKTTGKTVLYTV